jgi:hypothetical protein
LVFRVVRRSQGVQPLFSRLVIATVERNATDIQRAKQALQLLSAQFHALGERPLRGGPVAQQRCNARTLAPELEVELGPNQAGLTADDVQ